MRRQMPSTYRGRTGFFLRGGQGLKVRVVNGAMCKLLNASAADTLTAIYSPRLTRLICLSVMSSRNERVIFTSRLIVGKLPYGVIGCRIPYNEPGLALNTTYPLRGRQRALVATWRNTYLSRRCLRTRGARDGNESGIRKISPNSKK